MSLFTTNNADVDQHAVRGGDAARWQGVRSKWQMRLRSSSRRFRSDVDATAILEVDANHAEQDKFAHLLDVLISSTLQFGR
eukprot:6590860-Pyramimonas_sp.AAC.1